MKLGSLFDGSGGFPLAGHACGVETAWMSEIEPYPIAVTKNIFTSAKHLGDISKINGAEIEPVDIITFGSPCQDLSVAGKRAGLKHEANGDDETTRSGLFMEAVRIIKEMRDATNGKYPTFALWENVPGAFSSNGGEDFRIVCEELIKIIEPCAVMPAVPKKGWAYADSYCGDGWSLAYRVFDAQYWGVPQRRRRIHLVLDLGGECARKVLFEREGVRGYFTPCGAERETAPGYAENCFGTADREGNAVAYNGENITSPLNKTNPQFGDPCHTLGTDSRNYVVYSFDSLSSNSMKSNNPHSGCREVDIAKCLDTTNPCPSKNQGGIAVVEKVPYTLKIRSGCEGGGKGALIQEDLSATLAINNDQYLFQPVPIHDMATRFAGKRGEKQDGKRNGLGIGNSGDAMNTLTSGDRHAVCYGLNCRNFTEYKELYPTLCAKPNGGQSLNYSGAVRMYSIGNGQAAQLGLSDVARTLDCMHDQQAVMIEQKPQYIVRRLTPTECARLQGFPDFWGHFPEKEDFTDEEYAFWTEVRCTHAVINGKEPKTYTKAQMLTWYNKLHTDSAEYKMWGNGIALPPAIYCMQGMVEVLKERSLK